MVVTRVWSGPSQSNSIGTSGGVEHALQPIYKNDTPEAAISVESIRVCPGTSVSLAAMDRLPKRLERRYPGSIVRIKSSRPNNSVWMVKGRACQVMYPSATTLSSCLPSLVPSSRIRAFSSGHAGRVQVKRRFGPKSLLFSIVSSARGMRFQARSDCTSSIVPVKPLSKCVEKTMKTFLSSLLILLPLLR